MRKTLALLVVLLAACGGGDGGEPEHVYDLAFQPVLGGTNVHPELGPSAVGADGVDEAEARLAAGGGYWVVDLVMTEEGIAAFNRLAKRCYVGAGSCPTKRIAIVLDGDVLALPEVQAPAFEADEIQVSGDLDEAQATALAEQLSS